MDIENVLNKLYDIVKIRINEIDKVIKIIDDMCLEKIVIDQRKEYNLMRINIMELLTEHSVASKFNRIKDTEDKIMNFEMINEYNDQSIVYLLIDGNNKAINEINNLIEKEVIDEKILELLDRLKDINCHNINNLSKFIDF